MSIYGPLGLPRAGTSRGDKARDEFVHAMLAIMGQPSFLWIPQSGDTTTGVEKSRHAATITWDASVAARLSVLGSGMAQDFDGDDGEGDTPDAVLNHPDLQDMDIPNTGYGLRVAQMTNS